MKYNVSIKKSRGHRVLSRKDSQESVCMMILKFCISSLVIQIISFLSKVMPINGNIRNLSF